MIKKMIVLIMIIIVVFSPAALANDGGAMLDDEELLTIEYELYSDEVEIGGTLDFTVKLTNNTKYIIHPFNIISIFANTDIDDSAEWYIDLGNMNLDIEAGQTTIANISVTVPENIYWYKDGDEYYCDFDFSLMYFAFYKEIEDYEANEENIGYEDWAYIKDGRKTTPLKITNLYDGSEFINLELNETETCYYFPELQDHVSYINNGKLKSDVYNELILENISANTITDIYIHKASSRNSQDTATELSPDEMLTSLVYTSIYLLPEDIPDNLEAYYKTTYKIGDLYYCNEITKEYDTEILYCPDLNITFEYLGYFKYSATVENKTDYNLENIYISFPDENIIYNADYEIELLKKNESTIIEFESSEQISSYQVGYIRDDKLYYWRVFYPSYRVEYIYYESGFYLSLSSITVTPTPSPTSTPSSTPSPTPKATASPTAEVTASPTVAPTNTSSLTPTVTVSPTPTNTPSIIITDIKRQSSIPLWVWYVLTVAIIISTVLIIKFRKKKDDRLNYE